MSIRLIRLTLENFKGVSSFVFEPDGQNATVLGSNGVGKTTLFDAYNWLLFGKDSAGRSDSSFDVKPYGKETPVCVVTGEFDAGTEGYVTLSRHLAEKLVRQRGTDETSIKNDYGFYINGVPKTKTQYDKFISDMCPPDRFRMVSDPDYFAGKLRWDDRRSVLTELFGDVDEKELLSDKEEWHPLLAAVGANSVADYRAILAAERKKVRADLDAIPALISEAEKAIPPEIREFDPEIMKEAESDLADAERRKADISSGAAVVELRTKLVEAEADLVQSETAYFNSDDYRLLVKRISDAEAERHEAYAAAARAETDLRRVERDLADANDRLDRFREEYQRIKDLRMSKDNEICPHCGQALPPDKIESIYANFNKRKSEQLESNITAGKNAKAEAQKLEAICAQRASEAEAAAELLEAAEIRLKDAKTAQREIRTYRDTEEYAFKKAIIDSIKAEIGSKRASVDDQLRAVNTEIDEINHKLDEIRAVAAAQATAQRQRRRMAELKDKGRTLGKRAAELDKLLDMAARFEQYKLSAIEDSVNSRFKYARFKLFDRQLNGGWAECCEVVVDNAPYSTNLNPGKKINAGLDIVSTLSEALGFSAPVWIDNAESYVSIMDIDAQVIQLKVDSSAHELTVTQ